MRRVIVLCPTRERAHRVERMAQSLDASCAYPERISLWLGYDQADETTPRLAPGAIRPNLVVYEAETEGLAAVVHRMAKLSNPKDDDVLLYIGDDCHFQTAGWDEIVATSIDQERDAGPLIFYPNDGLQRGRMTIWWWASGKTARALDWIMSPDWNVHNDTWIWCLSHLFRPGRVRYFEDVMMRHLWEEEHPRQLDTREADVEKINGEPGRRRATAQYAAMNELLACWALKTVDQTRGYDFQNRFECHARDPYKGDPALAMGMRVNVGNEVVPWIGPEAE